MAEELVRGIAEIDPAALWLSAGMVGLTAVFVAYIGVVLVAALKADTPEARRYRSRLLRDLLRFVRDLYRGWGER
jgi:hypothetical protein